MKILIDGLKNLSDTNDKSSEEAKHDVVSLFTNVRHRINNLERKIINQVQLKLCVGFFDVTISVFEHGLIIVD